MVEQQAWVGQGGHASLGAWYEACCDSCLRGAQCLNLLVPRDQPSSTTTKVPAALLLSHTHTHIQGCMTEGVPLLQQAHTNTGGPLYIPSLTMETPGQHSIVMDIRAPVCAWVCTCRAVGGGGRRQGAAVVMLKRPWPLHYRCSHIGPRWLRNQNWKSPALNSCCGNPRIKHITPSYVH